MKTLIANNPFELQRPTTRQARSGSAMTDYALAIVTVLAAVPVVWLIERINDMWPNQREKAMSVIAASIAIFAMVPALTYVAMKRRAIEPGRLGLILLATVAVLLVGVYLYWVSPYVTFPGDFLIWTESDFVNDILKYRVGYPHFTAESNNESFTYLPGTQLMTYYVAQVFGHAQSIPAYRMIQVGYTCLAALVGLACCRRIFNLAAPLRTMTASGLWAVASLPLLVLFATNTLTNPFVHNLHNDALAQLISVLAFLLLLEYATTRSPIILAAMAVIPAAAFLVKQSLLIWAPLYFGYLLIFDRPRSWSRMFTFGVGSAGLLGATLAFCHLRWGDDFWYWAITVLGKHGVSPLRGVEHALDAWAYFAAALFAGLVLLRGENYRQLLGAWLVTLTFFAIETYTSGVAYMRNHMGPGSLLAGVWLLAALPRVWPIGRIARSHGDMPKALLRSSLRLGIVGFGLAGLGVVRMPVRFAVADGLRYVSEIEREFADGSPESILLDMGTWVYVPNGVVMKDRAPCIGERGFSETGDFSAMIGRLNDRHYTKILVRKLHEPDCWYDYSSWRKSSGIKKALLDNYREVRVLQPVSGDTRYGFGAISVLVPRS